MCDVFYTFTLITINNIMLTEIILKINIDEKRIADGLVLEKNQCFVYELSIEGEGYKTITSLQT